MDSILLNTEPLQSHHVIVRLIASLLIVLSALVDLLFWHAPSGVFWLYSCFMVFLVTLACLAIAGFGHDVSKRERLSRVGRQCLHWLGFAVLVYLLNELIQMGTFLPKHAGLILLGILGFSVYLAGLAVDFCLIPVGIVLLLLAMSELWVHQHFWLLAVPIAVAVILLLLLIGFVYKRKSKDAR